MESAKMALNAGKFLLTKPGTQILKRLVIGYENYPYSFRQFLKKVENEPVTSVKVFRTPLPNTMMLALNAVTFGQLKKKISKEPYENFFHLGLLINGKYILEKNQVVTLIKAQKRDNTEYLDVAVPPGLTIGEMVEKTRVNMGPDFFNYDALRNNCQRFAHTVLKVNGFQGNYDSFILQDIVRVFQGMKGAEKTIKAVTELGNRANFFVEGEGVQRPTYGEGIDINPRTKKVRKLDTTSSSDIMNLLHKLDLKIVENRVFMKDQINENLQEGNYIMNLEDSDQGGSHWTAFIKDKKNVYYFDSMGELPPQDCYDIFRMNRLYLFYSTQHNQDIDANSCGFWVVFWLKYMNEGKGAMSTKFNKFNKMFNPKNQKENEKKLLQIYQKLI